MYIHDVGATAADNYQYLAVGYVRVERITCSRLSLSGCDSVATLMLEKHYQGGVGIDMMGESAKVSTTIVQRNVIEFNAYNPDMKISRLNVTRSIRDGREVQNDSSNV